MLEAADSLNPERESMLARFRGALMTVGSTCPTDSFDWVLRFVGMKDFGTFCPLFGKGAGAGTEARAGAGGFDRLPSEAVLREPVR